MEANKMEEKDYSNPKNWGKEEWEDAAISFSLASCAFFLVFMIMWVFC